MGKVLKYVAGIAGLLCLGLFGYLWIAPPALLKVGTNYSAKIVCSNVFIAGRDAQEVLALDVQAPGHPLLRYVSVKVDPQAQSVQAHLFGFLAPARSYHREGLGCTNVHTAVLSDASLPQADPLPTDAVWPQGGVINPLDNPTLGTVLSDPGLLGEGMRAVVVVKDGRIVGEVYGAGFDADTPLLGWSMTKTVTAALIGTLIQSGQMALTDNLTESYPDWAADARKDITVADMLAMSSGLQWNEDYGDVSDVTRMLYLSDDMTRFASARSLDAPTGTEFYYSSGTSTLLSRVWQDAAGQDDLAYAREALFEPLGMRSVVLETDAQDVFVGSSYMYATARDWARFAQFLLQKGVWNDQQILPLGFTDWMAEPVAASDGRYGKGHIWLHTGSDPTLAGSVWLRGHDGQSIGVFPSHDMAIIRLGLTPAEAEYSSLPLAKAVIAAINSAD
ncbi:MULTISPECIES: serine hydrolase [unclassified Ruegeria]|uniref:serine hydrolase domain-containing protein n=1 Tax=unclassified Ruegeria TaxID=2625375 RepID=UPI001487C2BF|nr:MULTISPECIES: serine hydrolase [unclassified Ruegeria]